VGAGEGQDHKERHPVLSLLDGLPGEKKAKREISDLVAEAEGRWMWGPPGRRPIGYSHAGHHLVILHVA